MRCSSIFSRLIFSFGVAYAFLWVLSVLLLIPYYFSAEFDYSLYASFPFMAKISSELSEHYLPLPVFFIALAFLFPLISIFALFLSFAFLKISEISKIRLISQTFYIIAILWALVSFVPMVWILRELVVVEGPVIQNWLANAMPLPASYIQAGQGFVSSIVIASKSWMATYGSVGLTTAMIVSSIISPIPNEVILSFAGMTMSPMSVAVFGALGSTMGGVLCFYIARLGGRPLAEKFMNKGTIASMDRWFQRWGSWAIILGRLVPFIPFDAISYLSGLAKVKIERFAFLTFLGSVPRCLFYAYVGELIAEYNLPILIALFVTMLTVFLFFKIKKEKHIVNRFNFSRSNIMTSRMKGESIPRHRLEPRKILLATLIIGLGILFEYIDEVVLSKSVPSGPDTFPPWIMRLDDSLLLYINPALVNPILSILLGFITHIGSTLAIAVFSVIFYFLGYKREAVLIFTTIALGTLIVFPLKVFIIRPRPYSTLSMVVALEHDAGSSFPSGHSERIFALATVLSRKNVKKVLLLYLLAVAVAFSRVYLGVHYPFDVFVGSFIGWAVGKITLRYEKKVFEVASHFVRLCPA